MTRRKLDNITKDRIIELLESRKFTDGQIAMQLGLSQSLVSYYRRKLGLQKKCSKMFSGVKSKFKSKPVTHYFDAELNHKVDVYKSGFAINYGRMPWE